MIYYDILIQNIEIHNKWEVNICTNVKDFYNCYQFEIMCGMFIFFWITLRNIIFQRYLLKIIWYASLKCSFYKINIINCWIKFTIIFNVYVIKQNPLKRITCVNNTVYCIPQKHHIIMITIDYRYWFRIPLINQ